MKHEYEFIKHKLFRVTFCTSTPTQFLLHLNMHFVWFVESVSTAQNGSGHGGLRIPEWSDV